MPRTFENVSPFAGEEGLSWQGRRIPLGETVTVPDEVGDLFAEQPLNWREVQVAEKPKAAPKKSAKAE